jgi:hypothetical protein
LEALAAASMRLYDWKPQEIANLLLAFGKLLVRVGNWFVVHTDVSIEVLVIEFKIDIISLGKKLAREGGVIKRSKIGSSAE